MPRRYWYIILTFVLVAQLSAFVFAPILLDLFPHLTDVEAATYWLIISNFIAVVMTLLFLRPDMRKSAMRDDAPTIGFMIKWIILGFFMAYFGQIFSNLITLGLFGVDEPSENTEVIMDLVETNIFLILVIVVFAPILEEVIFRKIIFGELYKRMNFFLAAVSSSLIFAVLHWDFEFLLSYIVMGLVFAFLYVKTKRILVPIIVHGLMNGFVVMLNLFVDIEELERRLQELENALAVILGG